MVASLLRVAARSRRSVCLLLMFERSVCVGRSRSVRYCRVAFGASPRPLLSLLLALPLAGCFLPNEIIPAAHRPSRRPIAPARANADAALPSVVWWRGFRSKELTDLIEEALTSNFDVAAAVARIVQADAKSRIAGAALLPIVDLNASATRSRASQTTGSGGGTGGSGGGRPSA